MVQRSATRGQSNSRADVYRFRSPSRTRIIIIVVDSIIVSSSAFGSPTSRNISGIKRARRGDQKQQW